MYLLISSTNHSHVYYTLIKRNRNVYQTKSQKKDQMDTRFVAERAIVIAMKGHPATGKSTVANAIATAPVKVESRGADGGGGGWHKLSKSTEMERLLDGYGGCWNYDVGELPMLVVDTTAPVKVDKLVAKVFEFINCEKS